MYCAIRLVEEQEETTYLKLYYNLFISVSCLYNQLLNDMHKSQCISKFMDPPDND